jgi:hypothetical protein
MPWSIQIHAKFTVAWKPRRAATRAPAPRRGGVRNRRRGGEIAPPSLAARGRGTVFPDPRPCARMTRFVSVRGRDRDAASFEPWRASP